MKTTTTYLSLLLTASLCWQACTTDLADKEQGQGRQAVSLEATTMPLETRADAALLAEDGIPYGKSMGVYAYFHDHGTWVASATPNFMFNQQATRVTDSDRYAYSPLKYWPNEEDDKVSFIAYYPFTDYPADAPLGEGDPTPATGIKPQLTNDGTGLPSFLYTVKDDADQQVDFMVSGLVPNLPKTRADEGAPGAPFNNLSVDDRVPLVFRHMTSKIEFRVEADPAIRMDVGYFTVRKLQITNINTQGLLTPSYDGTTTTFEWTGQKTPHTYDCTPRESYLLLPQPLSNDAQLIISYDLVLKSDSTSFVYAGGKPVATDTYMYSNDDATVQLNTLLPKGSSEPLDTWLPHHHYVYLIRLRARGVSFTAQVVYWGQAIYEGLVIDS